MARRTYNEDAIDVLSPIEGIRKRPSMYIGPVDSSGVFHILKEVADNTVDEALAGRNDAVTICLEDGWVWVGDNGSGIPTGKHKKTGISTLETVLTHTHAGGKFGQGGYGASIGTHGVGIKATNALSEELEVWTCYKRKWYTAKFKKGATVSKTKPCQKPTLPKGMKSTGTIIRFKPDMTIFNKGSKLKIEPIHDWCEITAYLNEEFHVTFINEGEVEEWYFENGLEDYAAHVNKENGYKQVALFHAQADNYDVCLSFVEAGDDLVEYYTSSSYNIQGGTHEKTLWRAYEDALYQFAKKDHEYEAVDLRDSIVGVFNIKLEEPKFGGQTKEKLVDKRAEEAYDDLYSELHKFFKKNKQLTQDLLDKATQLYEQRSSSKLDKDLARKLTKEKKAGAGTLLPGKLTQVPKCKPELRELFLVEGDSAGGPCVAARKMIDRQEILALKGKPINAARSDAEKYGANQEVFNILLALGFDPSAKNPMDKLRVKNKVVFLADPDPDGDHINLLLLALIAKVLPQMIEKGMVYIAKAPEYYAVHKGKNYYGQTKDELTKALPRGANVPFHHIKGWGEASPKILREVAFDPETRMLQQVTVDNMKEIQKFIGLMSDDIKSRKQILGI